MVEPTLAKFSGKYRGSRSEESDVEPAQRVLPPAQDKEKTLEQLAAKFHIAYKAKLAQSEAGRFSFFRRSRLPEKAPLEDILRHAIYHGGKRSLRVLQELEWLDARKQGILENDDFRECMPDKVRSNPSVGLSPS